LPSRTLHEGALEGARAIATEIPRRPKLPPELLTPLSPPRYSLLMAPEEWGAALSAHTWEVARRYVLLLDAYQIAPGRAAGESLAQALQRDYGRGRPAKHPLLQPPAPPLELADVLAWPPAPDPGMERAMRLAREHIAGFQEGGTPRGRPSIWTPYQLLILAGEVLHELETGAARTASEAFRRISARPPWATWLKKREAPRWHSGRGGRGGPWDALRKAYRGMSPRWRAIGEDAYRFHQLQQALTGRSERPQLLELIHEPPEK
jgi:hypothetical protein